MKVNLAANRSQTAGMALDLPVHFQGSFNYVDCGAQGDRGKSLLSVFADSRYIGFDPQQTIPAEGAQSSTCFPVAIGQSAGTTKFYRTKNPNCSSVFSPNVNSLKYFHQLGEFLEVQETVQLDLVTLDEYLPAHGIREIDFIELDTQGSELDILKGAKSFLASSVLGIRVEVEFFPIYDQQPLFGEVDAYLRQFGFMLFDLERYHLRRKSSPVGVDSREQILWGQALYFRNFPTLPVNRAAAKQQLCKLAMTASYYGFHGYALDVINFLGETLDLLTPPETKELQDAAARYISRLQGNPVAKRMRSLDKSLFHQAFRRWGDVCARWYEAYRFVTSRQKYFWKD